ncbi:MAG: preprotein translocase subunit YajC [Holosporales bacterium]|nr:preprotein translocase subunit YajC [Holosporales bacterium]
MQLPSIACLVISCSSLAMADGQAVPGGGLMSFLPMLAFVAILYFLLIRPQQKRTKQHKAMIAAIKKGDKVVTSCGILATVSKIVSDQEVVLEIADGVHCKFVKSSIANVVGGDAVIAESPVPQESKSVEANSDAAGSSAKKQGGEKKVAKIAKSESPVRRKTTTKK